tara:strand:+ start:4302 stop:4619 length:318 start_codon:yes stop_codon:yes gene_type:complete
MEHLFTKTSNVLRDNWIIELQKENSLLKSRKNVNINPFFGYKIKIVQDGNVVPTFEQGTEGIIYDIKQTTCYVLYKSNNKKKLSAINISNIEFIDKRFDSFFSNN